MARAERNWDRLVRAALRGDRLVGGAYGHPVTGIFGVVPSSLGNNVHIEEVLRAPDEIQDEDPTVARILCEHAYALAQNLDPNSEGRGVLQFKTGLMSVIRVYWISWAVLGCLLFLLLVFSLNPKAMVHFQLFLRLVKSIALLMVLAGLIVAIVRTKLTVTDVLASILAFVPTGWGILSIAVAWKPVVKKLGLWKTVRSIARLYDAAMGMVIFIPIAICSWFPFISTFQTRLLYNQAFSRGLEISLILAGNNPNAGM